MKEKIGKYKLIKQGKVRDIYTDGDVLLVVASDRISAFDYILPSLIPDKGKVLNRLSCFWFDFLSDIVDNHKITCDLPEEDFSREEIDYLKERSMLARKAEVFPFECVVRGYLSGSGWKDYRQKGEVCGIKLPAGLLESQKLPQPIFTPATKAEKGHDENVTFEYMRQQIGEVADYIKEKSLALYNKAYNYAWKKGIIIADTKFEFGRIQGKVVLIDEVFTPDSSRFWPQEEYSPGLPQKSFDKQFVRDYLSSSGWDKNSPPPALPQEIINKTREKYIEIGRRFTGERL